MSVTSSSPSTSSFWCYTCTRYIPTPTHRQDSSLLCPHCNTGFIEQTHNPTRSPEPTIPPSHQTHFPPPDMDPGNYGAFEIYYDDGSGSGLTPLPVNISAFLLGPGFDRLLHQLTQIEANQLSRAHQNSPASKSAVDSLPNITIEQIHISTESYCAVCKDAFELQTEAKQMPCKHLYHPDCILPWLNLRNSCPVCRHELPPENRETGSEVGLTIWRLPGGGFAVGRRGVVGLGEMGGGFEIGGGVVRVGGGGGGGGWWRVLGGVVCCFGGGGRRRRRGVGFGYGSGSSSDSDDGMNGGSRFIPASVGRSERRRRTWGFDDRNSRPRMW